MKRIHFVGIGGAGMSGIAEILHNLGFAVQRLGRGRERHHAGACASWGLRVEIGHAAEHRPGPGAGDEHRREGRQPEVLAARASATSRRLPAR